MRTMHSRLPFLCLQKNKIKFKKYLESNQGLKTVGFFYDKIYSR